MQKTNILVVDDEKGQRDILKLILNKEGYEIIDVPGVREAFEQLEREFIERDVDSRLIDLAPEYKEAEKDEAKTIPGAN